MRLLAVRHGETEYARERRFAGARDVALNPRGRAQCEALARALAGVPLAAIYTSPQERARTSAEAIAKPHRLEVRVEPAFREMAFGQWEGLTRAELAARWPTEAEAWTMTPEQVRPPGGEPLNAVHERVVAAVTALRAAHAGETVVLVSHAIVTRLIVLAALGLPPARLWSVDASPAGITELEYQADWVTVHRMNTLAHLDGAAEAGS